MGFINLTKITPAAPNDPTVNEVTQLNNNWDEINTRLEKMKTSPGIIDVTDNPVANNVEIGMEAARSNRLHVWDGSAWRFTDVHDTGWSAWTNIPLSISVASRPGFIPQYRTNSLLRLGELRGCLLKDGIASAWTHNLNVVASNAVSQPIASFTPVTVFSYMLGTSIPTTPTTQTAAARGFINGVDGWRLTVCWEGSSGGGNFISLDDMKWWY